MEALGTNALQTAANGHIGQAGKIFEGRYAYGFHRVGDYNRGYVAAIMESTVTNCRHIATDSQRGLCAIIEGMVANVRHTIADDDGLDIGSISIPRFGVSIRVIRHGTRLANLHDVEGIIWRFASQCP